MMQFLNMSVTLGIKSHGLVIASHIQLSDWKQREYKGSNERR